MRRQKLFRTSTLKFRQSFRELTQTFLILVTHMQTLPNGMKRQKILQEDLLKTLQNMRATRQEKLLFQLVRSYKNSFFVNQRKSYSAENMMIVDIRNVKKKSLKFYTSAISIEMRQSLDFSKDFFFHKLGYLII